MMEEWLETTTWLMANKHWLALLGSLAIALLVYTAAKKGWGDNIIKALRGDKC